jgi:hypothetical protein
MFREIMKLLIHSLYGRQIRGEQSLNDMRISQPGIALFMHELDRRTGFFPYAWFDEDFSKVTYNSMKEHYDNSITIYS